MIRRWLSRLVCFSLGHLYVHHSAMWRMLKLHEYNDLDAICLRCSRVTKIVQPLVDSVFAPSPLLKHLRDKYGESDETQT